MKQKDKENIAETILEGYGKLSWNESHQASCKCDIITELAEMLTGPQLRKLKGLLPGVALI